MEVYSLQNLKELLLSKDINSRNIALVWLAENGVPDGLYKVFEEEGWVLFVKSKERLKAFIESDKFQSNQDFPLRWISSRAKRVDVQNFGGVSPSLDQFKDLAYLNLASNDLSQFPIAITNLRKLEMLKMGWNNLKKIPEELLKLPKLESLDLKKNGISSLEGSFNHNRLSHIDLSENCLENFPQGELSCLGLRSLYLQHNQLTTLNPTIGGAVELQTLLLGYNQLQELPKELSQTRLMFLYAQNNQLSEFPSCLLKLPKLCDLNLNGNEMVSIPNEIGGLTKLKILRLANNKLKVIPKEIGNLRMLKYLFLGGNKIEQLPQSIGLLKDKLQSLDLEGNPICQNKAAIAQLRLRLPHTEIKGVEA